MHALLQTVVNKKPFLTVVWFGRLDTWLASVQRSLKKKTTLGENSGDKKGDRHVDPIARLAL